MKPFILQSLISKDSVHLNLLRARLLLAAESFTCDSANFLPSFLILRERSLQMVRRECLLHHTSQSPLLTIMT